ncbi:MAG: hypothetical protein AAF850_07835 [Pseudomonadota bacterium]
MKNSLICSLAATAMIAPAAAHNPVTDSGYGGPLLHLHAGDFVAIALVMAVVAFGLTKLNGGVRNNRRHD